MKNKYFVTLSTAFVLLCTIAFAQQKDRQVPRYEQAYLGFGIGLDHGGIGVRAEFLPAKWLGVFAGAGYNLVDPGINAGASLKMLPGKRVTPTAVFMYGYNAAIKIRNHLAGTEIHRETYSGFSAGAGIDAKTGKAGSNKFSVTLFLPFRTSVFHNDYESFKEAGYEFQSKPVPIAISIGYHLAIADKLRKG